jgi:hypothetical protein
MARVPAALLRRLEPLCWSWPEKAELRDCGVLVTTPEADEIGDLRTRLLVFGPEASLLSLEARHREVGERIEKLHGDGEAAARAESLAIALKRLPAGVSLTRVCEDLAITKKQHLRASSMRGGGNDARARRRDAFLALCRLRQEMTAFGRKHAVHFGPAVRSSTEEWLAIAERAEARYLADAPRVLPPRPPHRPRGRTARAEGETRLRALGVSEEMARELLVAIHVAALR